MEGWGHGGLIGGPVALKVSLGHMENNLPGHVASLPRAVCCTLNSLF